MRAIFIFLIVGNAAFFGYHYFKKGSIEIEPKLAISQNVSGANRLRLLNERAEGSGSPFNVSERAERQMITAQKPDQPLCTMIGPYNQLLQAEYSLELLNSLGVESHITPIEIKEGELYWVYLHPEMSEREALRRLYELQGKGVESHVITKGELTNGISFGRYTDYAQAEARVNELKKLGYEVSIKMLPKVIQETWLIISPGFAEKIGESVWLSLLSKEDSLEKRQNFCLGVDSP